MSARGRHGLRGPLAWPPVPAMRTRREVFDELVLDALDRLRPVLGDRVDDIEVAVEDVPPTDPAPWEERIAPLGRAHPRTPDRRHRVVVYRRPVESRARDPRELAVIIDEVTVEQVAALLGLPPDELSS